MGMAIKTIYDKAVEIALLTVDEPETMPADELEYAVFRRAATYVPLLQAGGVVPSMLRYVGDSEREYVFVAEISDDEITIANPVEETEPEWEGALEENDGKDEKKTEDAKVGEDETKEESAEETPEEKTEDQSQAKLVNKRTLKLPPKDTFLGIAVRRILPDLVQGNALVTIGTDTCNEVTNAFVSDHKGCVVFAERA